MIRSRCFADRPVMALRTLTRHALALAVSAAVLAGPSPARPAQAANGVVGPPCDENAFTTTLNQVQATGGGTLSFNCGFITDIMLSSQKTIFSTVTIDGGGVMTLSGGNNTRHFILEPGAALTLTRVTLSNGYANGDGGAIYMHDGTRLVVDQSTFRDNQTTLAGSGGAIVSFGGPLTITNSLFEDNQGANAGAVYPRHGNAVTYIANSTFRRNRTTSPTDGWGGALLNWDGAPMTIVDSQFISNTARLGGALFNFGPTIMRNSFVLSNTATRGGGLYNVSVLHVDGVTVRGNTSGHHGGGLYNGGGTAVITASTFSGNQANYAQAILQAGVLTMTNGSLTGSWTILGTLSSTITNLRFVTIASLSAPLLVYNYENNVFQMQNVLLSNPGRPACFTEPLGLPMTSLGNNLATDNTCNLTQGNDQPNTPALLGPLADNGGPTQTMVPQPGSQAINNGLCQGYAPTDQRGLARPQGVACDIGAVEVQELWFLRLPLLRR